MAECAQCDRQRQMRVQRIQIASETRVHSKVGDTGQTENACRIQQHALFALGVQWMLQNAAESAMPNSVTAMELQRSTASAIM